MFSTVTVIVFPLKLISAPFCAFVITASDILYVLFSNTFVTCTVIGAVIIFSYPAGAFVSSIVIVSVPVAVTAIGPIFISPLAFVVFVTSPFGEFILNSAPSNLLLVPSSTFTSFRLYSLVFGINLFSTVTVIVFPDNVKLAPVCAFVICAVDILYVLFSNTFVTCTVIGAVIIFS